MGSFVSKAPCRDADPWLFDQFNLDLIQPALNYCSRCIFWQECDSLVQPKTNFYDGVVAGKVWRNGRILAKLDATSPNRLIVGEELDDETMAVRGSQLHGSGDGLLLSREEQNQSREFISKEDL